LLSRDSGIGFVNRNAPSWNSHQELVALAKYPGSYQVSLSYSLANDIARYCQLSNGKDYVLGEPESFAILRSYFNDIRGVPLEGDWSFLSCKRLFAKLEADFCKQYCFDLSAVFDKFGGATHIDENVGIHYRPRLFINDVHLTDQGNQVMGREMARLLVGLPIP
jgi:hypothetical protein